VAEVSGWPSASGIVEGIIGQRLDLHYPILRRQWTHAAAVTRRLQFVILVVKLAFSRARSQSDAMVVIEEQTLPGVFAACAGLARDKFGCSVGPAVVVGAQQPKLVVDRHSDPRVLVISRGKTGKAQGLCTAERECGLGVISKRNVAAPKRWFVNSDKSVRFNCPVNMVLWSHWLIVLWMPDPLGLAQGTPAFRTCSHSFPHVVYRQLFLPP
jgi:hypothetical protein